MSLRGFNNLFFVSLILIFLVLGFLAFLPSTIFPQEVVFLTNYNPYTNDVYGITNFSYRGISIGMTRSYVESLIDEDPFLEIDETSYLGLFDKEKPFVLKVRSFPYLQSAYFVFNNGVLFNMIIRLNPEIYSYSELVSEAKKKYGPPTDERPYMAVWQAFPYELRVEKPSVVKFFLTDEISNVNIKAFVSYQSNKIKAEYTKKQLSPF